MTIGFMTMSSFKTPQDVIQDYYRQKYIKSVTPKKPTEFLMFARSSNKRLLRDLYLKEHWIELYFAELARKNYH